jgi:hypothetical protein
MPFMVVAGEAWAWLMGALLLGAVLQAVRATEARKAIEAIRSMEYSFEVGKPNKARDCINPDAR